MEQFMQISNIPKYVILKNSCIFAPKLLHLIEIFDTKLLHNV